MTSNYTNFNLYISRILKQVHPTSSLKNQSRALINKLIVDLTRRLAEASSDLNKTSKRKTISTKDVIAASSLILNGHIVKHAKNAMLRNVKIADDMISQGKRVTNKTFPIPISRAKTFLYERSKRVTMGAGVAVATFIEYLISEILELAGNAARDQKRITISPQHISVAIHDDEELRNIFKTMNFLILGD